MNEAEIIYQHFLNLEDKLKISIDDCDIIETNESKLNKAIEDTENRLKVKLKNGKCSKFLIKQISIHRLNIG